MNPAFDLRDVDVRYGHVCALSQITLQIRAGERVALVGANGSGKSTLLRLLHGLATPARGTARCMDRSRQAMLFQRPYMLRTSVRNQVSIALWLRGRRWCEARTLTLHALARVDMVHLAERNARSLSGGQQQRLALAQAWASGPDALLLDEPTASLDPRAKRDVEALMDEFAQPRDGRDITMVFSSHNLAQVRRLADRVIYLENGRVIVDLPIEQFFTGPLPESARLFVTGESL
jgi:tungstate transport system ATP-binding protein